MIILSLLVGMKILKIFRESSGRFRSFGVCGFLVDMKILKAFRELSIAFLGFLEVENE